jgi:predicted nucleic acid-binding protein
VTYLLDTNVVSELRKGSRCHARVASWFEGVDDQDLGLSVLVIGEIRRGIEAVRRRDSRGASALERWLGRLLREHAERVLPIDARVAEEWGRLSAIRPGSVVDVLLAATARVHGLTLVTRNVRDVEWTGVAWLNPFEPPPAR